MLPIALVVAPRTRASLRCIAKGAGDHLPGEPLGSLAIARRGELEQSLVLEATPDRRETQRPRAAVGGRQREHAVEVAVILAVVEADWILRRDERSAR